LGENGRAGGSGVVPEGAVCDGYGEGSGVLVVVDGQRAAVYGVVGEHGIFEGDFPGSEPERTITSIFTGVFDGSLEAAAINHNRYRTVWGDVQAFGVLILGVGINSPIEDGILDGVLDALNRRGASDHDSACHHPMEHNSSDGNVAVVGIKDPR